MMLIPWIINDSEINFECRMLGVNEEENPIFIVMKVV